MDEQTVWVVLSDSRERHRPVLGVHTQFERACETAKAYILEHNSDADFVIRDKELPAEEFCAKYISAWLVAPSIIESKMT